MQSSRLLRHIQIWFLQINISPQVCVCSMGYVPHICCVWGVACWRHLGALDAFQVPITPRFQVS